MNKTSIIQYISESFRQDKFKGEFLQRILIRGYMRILKNSLVSSLMKCAVLVVMVLSFTTKADNKKLPIPRFVLIKSHEVNIRSGPSTQSAIEWVFVKKGEPVEIIAEYGEWRQIRDIQGEKGWIHVSVLLGKRSVVITSRENVNLTTTINPDSIVIAKLQPQVRCVLKKCDGDYCKVMCQGYTGWLPKTAIWGVYYNQKEY